MMKLICRRAVIFYVFFLSLAFLYGENSPTVSLSGRTSIIYGKLGEYVYWPDRTVSYLEWNVKPAFSVGFDAELYIQQRFFVKASFDTGIPGRTGIMEDSDWGDPDPSIKTHYSRHDAYLNGMFVADFGAGYRYSHHNSAVAKIFFGYKYIYYHMDGRDGFTEYMEDDYQRIPIYGTGITYRQQYQIAYVGGSIKRPVTDWLGIGITGQFSPLVVCDALDNHHKRELDFYDSMKGGLFLSIIGNADFQLRNQQAFSLIIGYSVVPEFRGSTLQINTETGSSKFFENSAGASLSHWTLGVGYRIQVK